jgi:glutamate-1-semialdehyde aminotransferase
MSLKEEVHNRSKTSVLWEKAVSFCPGVLPDVSEMDIKKVSAFAPVFAEGAKGAHITDIEGTTYIDYVMCWGACIFGYNYQPVTEAIIDQLSKGLCFSIAAQLQVEVGEKFARLIPCAEQVYFGKNGSDACTAAVRVARLATNREEVAICKGHFHGFHDWFACVLPYAKGIPQGNKKFLHEFYYNDADSLLRIFKKRPKKVAAVILEPVRDQEPEKTFLRDVIEIAHCFGALVIFDEMITGLRLAPGGAQEYYDITPDLACFGKSVANGMPLSLTAGPKDLMRFCPEVFTQMTFQYEQLSLSAAKVIAEEIADGNVSIQLWQKGETLKRSLQEAAKKMGVEIIVSGPAPRLSISFPKQCNVSSKKILTYFLEELFQGGIICNGNLLPSFSHTQADLLKTTEVFNKAMESLADALGKGDLEKRIRCPFDIV